MSKKYNIKFQDKEYKRITGKVRRRENGLSVPNGDIYTFDQAVKSLKILRAQKNAVHNYTMEETA